MPACCKPSWVTTAVESIKLLERRIVFPIADDSRGSVSIVRQRIGRASGDVVVDENVVCQRFESLVELAGRINDSSLKQPFDSVILGLLHPFALRSERADIWGVGYVRGSDNRK